MERVTIVDALSANATRLDEFGSLAFRAAVLRQCQVQLDERTLAPDVLQRVKEALRGPDPAPRAAGAGHAAGVAGAGAAVAAAASAGVVAAAAAAAPAAASAGRAAAEAGAPPAESAAGAGVAAGSVGWRAEHILAADDFRGRVAAEVAPGEAYASSPLVGALVSVLETEGEVLPLPGASRVVVNPAWLAGLVSKVVAPLKGGRPAINS